ncbi:MAG: AIM24 family protein [Planctomycetota bacterium]
MSEAAVPRRYTLDRFVEATVERELREGLFELESERILDINLEGEVWIKTGSMIAYTGAVKFVREKLLEQGLGNLLKKAVGGEGARLTKATGSGSVFCADIGKKITILELQGESIFVNGNDLLAFETTLSNDIKMMKKVGAMLAGGLFNVKLEGHGLVAVTSHYEPLTLPVVPGEKITTDPNATVMWSGGLEPKIKTDLQLKTFLGRGSGESVQMEFEGDGFVVVQPYEEVIMQAGTSS